MCAYIYIYIYISCCSLCVSVGYLLSASVKSEPPQPTATVQDPWPKFASRILNRDCGLGGFRVGTAFRMLKPSHFDAVSYNKFIQAERGKPDRETAGSLTQI